jgi:hypothetical protein
MISHAVAAAFVPLVPYSIMNLGSMIITYRIYMPVRKALVMPQTIDSCSKVLACIYLFFSKVLS